MILQVVEEVAVAAPFAPFERIDGVDDQVRTLWKRPDEPVCLIERFAAANIPNRRAAGRRRSGLDGVADGLIGSLSRQVQRSPDWLAGDAVNAMMLPGGIPPSNFRARTSIPVSSRPSMRSTDLRRNAT